jgi:hypothetical protein
MKQGSNGNYSLVGSLLKLIAMFLLSLHCTVILHYFVTSITPLPATMRNNTKQITKCFRLLLTFNPRRNFVDFVFLTNQMEPDHTCPL